MWKANGRTDTYPWQKLTWPMAKWAKKQNTEKYIKTEGGYFLIFLILLILQSLWGQILYWLFMLNLIVVSLDLVNLTVTVRSNIILTVHVEFDCCFAWALCNKILSEFSNKNVDIKFSSHDTTYFWNNLHQVRSKSKDWKTK
jgi:hypothetical protein